MSEESKLYFCKKCERMLPLGKIRTRVSKRGVLHIDNICKSCHAKRDCANLRLQMFEHLGDRCACCGESHPYFLTLEHINGDSSKHFYGRKDMKPAHREQSNTYVELRKARRSGWDRTQYEVLCINCNFAKGHYGQCPHRTGVTKEQVLTSLEAARVGIGYERSVKAMVEGGKVTRFTGGPDPRRPEMKGNKFAAHLTADQVREIKMLRGTGKFQREVAEQYGVSRALVGLLWSDKRWKELRVN